MTEMERSNSNKWYISSPEELSQLEYLRTLPLGSGPLGNDSSFKPEPSSMPVWGWLAGLAIWAVIILGGYALLAWAWAHIAIIIPVTIVLVLAAGMYVILPLLALFIVVRVIRAAW